MFTEMKMQKFKLKYIKEVCLTEVVKNALNKHQLEQKHFLTLMKAYIVCFFIRHISCKLMTKSTFLSI